MALFRRGASESGGAQLKAATTPREAYCRICRKTARFSQCWLRVRPLRQCECCGAAFEDPNALYRRNMPRCPRCEELLEQPGFEYGLCDGCGSKFELVDGTLPNLLPNLQQRKEMDKYGKARSVD